jgi:hypothetical protein
VLIARDMTTEPTLRQLWLVPFYIFYRVPLLINQVTQVLRELLFITFRRSASGTSGRTR